MLLAPPILRMQLDQSSDSVSEFVSAEQDLRGLLTLAPALGKRGVVMLRMKAAFALATPTQFACSNSFTSTKVQILTPKPLLGGDEEQHQKYSFNCRHTATSRQRVTH